MIHSYIVPLQKEFLAHVDSENSLQMSKYMKNKFVFFGIKSPLRKDLLKEFLKLYGLPPVTAMPEIVRFLWQQPQREYQYVAIDLLEKFAKKQEQGWLLLFEELVITKSWWDTVDLLAAHCVAAYFNKYPDQKLAIIEKWLLSENMWLQRTCLLFQLNYKKQTDEALLFGCILRLAESKEFFIQKAIGWALRQYARTNPQAVLSFTESAKLKPLSLREALKHFSPLSLISNVK
jgi:3-methyladenine DNA glycosylase AlkD